MQQSHIEEERDYATEDNTAQDELMTLLERIDAAHAEELRVDLPLQGDVDLSVLHDRGLKRITKIVFAPGKITSLRNVPEGITRLDCPDQLLTDVDGLPSTLVELNLSGNSIKKFTAGRLTALQHLNVANNELDQIDHLPETLTHLVCENNQLRRLDLSRTRRLVSLHCSNNPLLQLEHVPPTLTDVVMENNPFIEVDRTAPTVHGASRGDQDRRYNYVESIQEFFRLKNEYDTKLRKMKRTAFDRAIGRRAGAKAAARVRAPCVSCKRAVGTVFARHDGRYTAVCGDKDKPCSLDIQIFNGDFFNLFELLELYKNDAADRQEKVIMQKLDTLFNYTTEQSAVAKFKEELEEYNFTTKMQQDTMRRYKELYDNEDHRAKINRAVQESYRIREGIQTLLDEYLKTGNREYLVAAVERQIKDLTPVIHSLRMLNYEMMMVDVDENDQSTLVQSAVAPYKQDFTYGEGPRVIKYVVPK